MKKFCIKSIQMLVFWAVFSSFVPGGFCQQLMENGFLGRGVSQIENDDVAEARRRAFIDAQEKVLVSAVSVYLPLEDIAQYFLMLKKLFFDHPDIYLERFKIVEEQALYDTYQVSVQGAVQLDLLRQDLTSMGLLSSVREKKRVLLMIAETGLAETEPQLWWKPGQRKGGDIQDQLAVYFRNSGFLVVDPDGDQPVVSAAMAGPDPEADPEKVAAFAAGFNADIVVVGRSELSRTENRRLTSVENVQCGISARVIRVRDASVLVQVVAYKLGMHVDQWSAARLAIDKACMHLSGQIADKIFLDLRNIKDYVFRMSLPEGSPAEEAENWLKELNRIVPDLVPGTVENSEEGWTVTVNSSLKRADIVQKILQFGVEGYTSEIVSADKDIIDVKITPVVNNLP